MMIEKKYGTVIVGAGHAGIEAALASARLGAKTALVTINVDHIVYISCNPSVGGMGKSHLVEEIDALGGEMARLADSNALQYKMLGRSKGMAVWSLRAQIDKYRYSKNAKDTLYACENLDVLQDSAAEILTENGSVSAVITERGVKINCTSAVLCTGTFLQGKIYIGDYSSAGGRIGELSSQKLADSLLKHGFTLGRLKTGTPARVMRSSIDTSSLDKETGDGSTWRFCWEKNLPLLDSLPCWITWTNEKTHEIIRANRHRSPLFTGVIQGIGPRYCPSIEDKVFRFADKTRHQIYLEPEGLDTEEVYVNGLSSSLPEDVQDQFIRTLPGLENVRIIKPAYAVEYDYIEPTHLNHSLESKIIPGLFFAGQINGTSGYEEAAGQGLVAGINAAHKVQNKTSFTLDRRFSYIGVMIDDLVLKGTKEPYRMFTSRAENRLSLRLDNADLRLTEMGIALGLVSDKQQAAFHLKKQTVDELYKLFSELKLSSEDTARLYPQAKLENTRCSYLFTRGDLNTEVLIEHLSGSLNADLECVVNAACEYKYAGYIDKQRRANDKSQSLLTSVIPKDFVYDGIAGLKMESVQKLNSVRPENIEHASRISGITPADVQLLLYHLKLRRK